jgi:hypothetical protein
MASARAEPSLRNSGLDASESSAGARRPEAASRAGSTTVLFAVGATVLLVTTT